MVELKDLITEHDRQTVPDRVERALWLHEHACGTPLLELRWGIVCTALEALLKTRRHQATRQFVARTQGLATDVAVGPYSEQDAKDAYDQRSRLAHGVSLNAPKPQGLALYRVIEELLRKAIRRAISDATFGSTFTSDTAIEKRWPA